MTPADRGGVRWLDQMRITRQHMDHLQATLRTGVDGLHLALGPGVVHGFTAEVTAPGTVTVSPGLAIDVHGRSLVLAEPRQVTIPEGTGTVFLAARHRMRSATPVAGIPTLFFDELDIEVRSDEPPFSDGGVAFAGVRLDDEGASVFVNGDWFLPPAQHGHSGTFVDVAGRARYDGHALTGGLAGAAFDSGFVTVGRGLRVELVHALQTEDLLVQVQRKIDGGVGTRGYGSEFWYELHDPRTIVLVRSDAGDEDVELRALAWPIGPTRVGPPRPIADAGDDLTVELGASFALDGTRSRGIGDRKVVKYVWTLVD